MKERTNCESQERRLAPDICRWGVGLCASCALLFNASAAYAQLSFSQAIGLAQRNSPTVKLAEDDVHRAQAALSEARDYYVPNLFVDGGLGRTYGITLTVPTIFTVNTQSLIYGPGQRDYIRGAKESLQASLLKLQSVRQQVEEDAAATYLALEEARKRRNVFQEKAALAQSLVDITAKRNRAGLDSDLDLKRARRTLLEIEVQQPDLDNNIATLESHLNSLMGIGRNNSVVIDATSIPPNGAFSMDHSSENSTYQSLDALSSEASARARQDQARGDSRFAFRPQVLMQSQYGRISPINDVSAYYNLNGHYNVSEFGIAIHLPLFDKVRSAKARESAAEAMHEQHQAEVDRNLEADNQRNLRSQVEELSKKLELAEVNRDIAGDELNAVLKEAQTASAEITGGQQMGPKDEINARMEERTRYSEWLEAQLQWRRAQLSLMRQEGELEAWLRAHAKDALPSSR